ncbi:energy transducer TonB [Pelagicoccus sp. SDUM812002]|uniref:energy transducer TonB n=1 Tax=Pelagicoccus sp. SDUM812002 TaxID=3041266 RepID=UPI00280CAC08|nr:energy transducer TonB [Pelagicoccus sp. SDUM812002]MDQ8184496.1 energy transducer TonB [Pelagicoccus sp. SDUM812002]
MKLAKSLLSACLLASLSIAETSAAPSTPFSEIEGIDFHFKSLKLPSFPQSLSNEGYMEGYLKVALDIDYAGELRDWLVLESSHPSFIQSLEGVIKDWRFTAPFVNGENRSIVTEIELNFRSSGNVVSLSTGAAASTLRYNEITGFRTNAQKLSSIKELDTFPYPIVQTPPSVPKELIDKFDGTRAVFTFYVDEAGLVRIPVLSATDGEPDLAMLLAAQDAISQWRFEPPTKNRKPVKIKLSQAFVFRK